MSSALHRGRLHAASLQGQPYEIRRLKTKDLPDIMRLQDLVRKDLERHGQQNFTTPKTEEQFQQKLKKRGCAVGILHHSALVGLATLYYPPNSNYCVIRDTGLAIPLKRIASVESVLVDPEHRGKRLAQQMLERLKELAPAEGKDVLISEVAMNNLPSLRAFEIAGFEIIHAGICSADNDYSGHLLARAGGEQLSLPCFRKKLTPPTVRRSTTPTSLSEVSTNFTVGQ